jgi:hypothetical protein
MEKNTYKILKNQIPKVKLHSLTGQYWFDSFGNLFPWSGGTNLSPEIDSIYYNVTGGTVNSGYYKWNGTTWISYTGSTANDNYIPIFLESSVDEMGVMVGFDGNITQLNQLANFTYTQTGSTIQIYNSSDPLILRTLKEETYTINWGDGNVSGITITDGTPSALLPTLSHTYSTPSEYIISITLDSPWTKQKLSKSVTIPQDISISNPLGTFSGFTIPFTINTGQTIDYLNDYDYVQGYTGNTTISFAAIGKSRISELKLYGSNTYSGVTTGTSNGVGYSAYTIDGLFYTDYSDGYTIITGQTSGYTKEEVFSSVITRNEHFLGFIDEPTVYSDIFIERGKQSPLENNLRLCEIDNVGELDVYGNGFFNVKKQ